MTRIRSGDIAVDGLVEFRKALKAMGDVEALREMRAANKEAATIVAGEAKDKAQSLGSVAAKVAPSIRVSAGQQSAGVSWGGSAYPMAWGAEFGGQRRPTTQQFRPWRGSDSGAGYFAYPAIRENLDRIVIPYEQAIADIVRKAGLT